MAFFRLIFLTGIISIFSVVVEAQVHHAGSIYESANHIMVEKYKFDSTYEHLVLASTFSKDEIKHLPFTDRRITRIDLVYTDYQEVSGFDQKALDIARLEKLIAINPEITVNKFFDWNVVGQTGCNTSATCKDFFHGFVIYYEPYYTKETAKAEIDSIKIELSQLNSEILELQKLLQIAYDRIPCEYPEMVYSNEYLSEKLDEIYRCDESYKARVFFDVELDYNGRPLQVNVKGNLFPCKENLAKALKYILKWKRGLVIGNQQYNVTAKGYISFPLKKESVHITSFEISRDLVEQFHMVQQHAQCVAYDIDTSYSEIIPRVEKRVVSDVLFRNNLYPDLVIVDVTGSMYPYTADLLKWIKLSAHKGKAASYVFFNDGDDKPTVQKAVGRTGGLYGVVSHNFTEVKDKMFEAMRGGGGGDLPENNFEALLYGKKEMSEAKSVVMIADNYSFPRDAALLSQYNGDLKIILCHTDKGIDTRYLDLARKYKFSLHTMESDINTLSDQQVGADFLIDGKRYRLENSGYERVRY